MQVRVDHACAWRNYREALDFDRLLGNQHSIAICLDDLGYIALHDGDVLSAARSFCDSIHFDRELGYRIGPCSFLEGVAASMSAAGAVALSARNYGAWDANCALPGTQFKLHQPDQVEFDRFTWRTALAVDPALFRGEREAGRTPSMEQAIDQAQQPARDPLNSSTDSAADVPTLDRTIARHRSRSVVCAGFTPNNAGSVWQRHRVSGLVSASRCPVEHKYGK